MDSLFPELPEESAPHPLAGPLARLADDYAIYIGTSSWKYPGWVGQLYSPERYEYRGRFAETRFNRDCLREYAETFRTVCVDAGYYQFPSAKYLQALGDQVPDGFKFSLKVTDEITIKKFTRLPRHGERAGKPNAHYLDPQLFKTAFLKPCATVLGEKLGLMIFEFSHFYPSDYERGRDFTGALDAFLSELPTDRFQFGVEIRNANFLHPDYFAMLAAHGVAHVFNSWQKMPALSEQIAMPGALGTADFTGARLLLKPGRPYQEAVDRFSPYDRVREPYPDVRTAATGLVEELKKTRRRPSYLYVNNRLEGNALATIRAILKV